MFVNIADHGPRARKTISAYTTNKAGVVGLTKALAVELGQKAFAATALHPASLPQR